MPLPDNGVSQTWPPAQHHGVLSDLNEWAAWYSGDTHRLGNVYSSRNDRPSERRLAYSTVADRMRFWARRGDEVNTSRLRLHVPVASDIATTSADLLFGEEPTLRIREAAADNAPTETTVAQDRLLEIADLVGLPNLLLEGAEVCAALGGVYLKPGWDTDVADHPLLDVVHGDAAVPDWRGDRLAAVTFWRVLLRDNNTVFRLLERHEPGVVLTGLYVGNETHLGTRVPLDRHPESADLNEEVALPAELGLGNNLMVRYVPNVRPNRKRRHLPIGRADYAGVESLMDALDEAYTSWMRDIRLGQARIVVSEDALQRRGRGQGAMFDADQEVFTALNLDPTTKASSTPITPVQFEIRTQQHLDTCADLFERIVTSSGYSPQTFGLHIGGQAESGTALRVREGKTLKTRGRKARFWVPAIETVLETMLAIDSVVLGHRDHGVYRPSVDEADVIVNNPVEVAQSLSMFRTAQAMSIETAVRMAQPDLDDTELAAEVARIKEEQGAAAVVDPTGGLLG